MGWFQSQEQGNQGWKVQTLWTLIYPRDSHGSFHHLQNDPVKWYSWDYQEADILVSCVNIIRSNDYTSISSACCWYFFFKPKWTGFSCWLDCMSFQNTSQTFMSVFHGYRKQHISILMEVKTFKFSNVWKMTQYKKYLQCKQLWGPEIESQNPHKS